MPEANKDRMTVACECGTELRVSADLAGRKGRCPTCNTVFTIPDCTTKPPPDPEPPLKLADEDDGNSLLGDLAAMETSQPAQSTRPTTSTTRHCNQCGKQLAAEAVMCVHCGYNLQSGKTLKGASAKRAGVGGMTRRLATGAGTFMMGCALSGVGALIGAAAWSGIAIVTNYEIGYIAWGLGVLAGLGMWIGYKEGNLRAGLTASVIALVGIVAAKATTFIYVNYPEISEARKVVATLKDEYVQDRDRLASHRALLKEMQNGLVPYSEQAEAAYDEAYFELVNTPPSELQAELAKLDTWEASEKWSDPKFVRNFVVYEFTNEAIRDSRHEQEDEDDEYPGIDARQWRTQRSDAIKEVDAMTPDEQLERAKTIENDRKRRTDTLRLAGHDAMIESLTMLPSESETLYSEFYEDRKIHYEDMSDDEFSEAVAVLDSWEKDGKWDDADYVKDQSTYNRVNDAISKRNENLPDDADYWTPTDEQWQELVDTATDDVNLMTHDQRAGKLKRTQREQEQKLEEIIAKFQQESADELADALADELTGHAFEFFVANSFGGMDLLFLVLAVGSAFKIATRGSEKD